MNPSIMDAAREYIAHGWRIVPLDERSKGTSVPGWNLPENAIDSPSKLTRINGGNIGLALAWTRIATLDIDDYAETEAMLADVGIDLNALMMASDAVQIRSRSNRGKLLYRLPDDMPPPRTHTIKRNGRTIYELRCATLDGKTVQDVLPPSIHPDTGQPYAWSGDWRQTPPLPGELLAHWRELGLAGAGRESIEIPDVTADDLATGMALLEPKYLAIVEGGADQGKRSEGIYAVIAHLVHRDATVAQIIAVLTHRSNGISEKVLEKRRPAAWLVPQIAKKRADLSVGGVYLHGGNSNAPAAVSGPAGWQSPQALTAKIAPEPYPLDALPASLRAAVDEVAGFVKAPVPLVAASALAALSVAAQAHVDVKRAERLQGPTGLYLLTIADSGERKSTCDGFFTAALRDYEKEQAEFAKPEQKRYAAEFAAWAAERDGILAAIKQAGKSGKPCEKLRRDLAELETAQPEAPRVPRLVYTDATPEALAWNLAKKWPSGGVISAEGGLVFGAHGMGRDSIMRNLAMLNQLWDANPLHIDRRTSESFTVRGARLTVALQIQEPTLRGFFEQSRGLARGTGFLARFLIAWPESTQGVRPYSEPPANWPHLAAFHRRIAAILALPAPVGDDGALSPSLLSLSPEAKAAWIAFHDAIEGELRAGGELADVRDVASKSADNAARLAALFHVFDHGAGGAIGAGAFDGASRIAAWHLSEARRFFGELALPVEMADAARLDGWLIEHCRRGGKPFVSKNHVRQHGPLRDGARLNTALRELDALDRTRLTQEGRRQTVRLNPALLAYEP